MRPVPETMSARQDRVRATRAPRRRVRRLAAFTACALAATLPTVRVSGANADEPGTGRAITLAFTGDVIAHVSLNNQAWKYGNRKTFDYRPMYADVRSTIQAADLAVCQLEGPIAPPGVRYAGHPRFAVPPQIVTALVDAGYDYCTTANNHSNDRGPAGIDATLDAFEAAGLGHAGSGRTAEEAVAPIIDVRGVKVALLAYTWGFGGQNRLHTKSPMRVNLLSPARAIADAKEARTRGAEVVIVSVHWGSEFRQRVTVSQAKMAAEMTASGEIDAIVGHHAHVLQPIKQVNGKWVLFGLGNGLSNQRLATVNNASTQDGVIAQLRIVEQPDGGFVVEKPVIIPTWVHSRTLVVYDVAKHYFDNTFIARYQKALRKSWARTKAVLGEFMGPLPPP